MPSRVVRRAFDVHARGRGRQVARWARPACVSEKSPSVLGDSSRGLRISQLGSYLGERLDEADDAAVLRKESWWLVGTLEVTVPKARYKHSAIFRRSIGRLFLWSIGPRMIKMMVISLGFGFSLMIEK